MIKDLLKDEETKMKKALESLKHDLTTIRTGRASPALVEELPVDAYGAVSPLIQLATISAPEPRMLTIRPFDASTMPSIEKAILKSDLGLTPSNDGKMIRLPIPPLTEERRREFVKRVHKRVEEAHIAIRNIRHRALDDLREMENEKMSAIVSTCHFPAATIHQYMYRNPRCEPKNRESIYALVARRLRAARHCAFGWRRFLRLARTAR